MEERYDPMEHGYDPRECKSRLDCIFVQNAPPYSNPEEGLFRMSSSGYMKSESLLLVAKIGISLIGTAGSRKFPWRSQ